MLKALLFLAATMLVSADFWDQKDPAQWLPQEVDRLLTNSPWAKPATSAFADAVIETMPRMQTIIRWESAKPIREALRRPLPSETTDAFVIGVTGMPIMGQESDSSELAESLKATTWLAMRGKAKWHPFRVHFEAKGAVLFFFDKDAGKLNADSPEVTFVSNLARFAFKARFEPKQMRYQGKPAM